MPLFTHEQELSIALQLLALERELGDTMDNLAIRVDAPDSYATCKIPPSITRYESNTFNHAFEAQEPVMLFAEIMHYAQRGGYRIAPHTYSGEDMLLIDRIREAPGFEDLKVKHQEMIYGIIDAYNDQTKSDGLIGEMGALDEDTIESYTDAVSELESHCSDVYPIMHFHHETKPSKVLCAFTLPDFYDPNHGTYFIGQDEHEPLLPFDEEFKVKELARAAYAFLK